MVPGQRYLYACPDANRGGSGVRGMRRRHRRLAAAACCVGALGVMAAVLLPGLGAGADQGDQPGTGHAKTHDPPAGHGHGNSHPGGWTSASTSARAHSAAADHTPTPVLSAQPTAHRSTWTSPGSTGALAAAPGAGTTMTLQGVPPAPHRVTHVSSQPADIVEVAAAPSRPVHDSVALGATISGVLVAIAIVALGYGYRPGNRQGRHRSA
jgi:hypothetical protein